MAKTVLKGITWGHSRGITPLLAASQRFAELHPSVEIHWDKRSLQEFADSPIEKLTEKYDLLIIDHPWVGCAAATRCVLPLDEYLSTEFLQDQLDNSVGGSHESYNYESKQWALAIDAATPVASFRADLFAKHNVPVPATWNEVLVLAREGRVAVPAIPIDLLMNFYMFCLAHGHEPFANEEEVTDLATGISALETMRELYSLVNKEMFAYNPIAVAEVMSNSNDYWYCPFAYGYSNYSRVGFARNVLHYTTPVIFHDQQPLRSTIGGTGLAISAFSHHKVAALVFAEMVVSGRCQSTLYVEHGGQPGHRSAWTSDSANMLTNNFFKNVLPAMENGYIRPRYNGYLYFQDHGGDYIQEYLKNGGNPARVLNQLNELYRESRVHANPIALI
jgi:multiple sugar transport system substrate-binding protein